MTGRPKADLNWEEINQLLVAGCSGVEIAGYCGVDPATIYDRCEKDNNKPFSAYSQEMKAKGQSILRAHQYAKALGKTDKGDNTLLIWLGKQRLDQKDKPIQQGEQDEFIENLAKAIVSIGKIPGIENAGGSEMET